MRWYLLGVFLLLLTAKAFGQCEDHAFASYFHDHMVLQKEGARVWGYAAAEGLEINVFLVGIGAESTTSFTGPEGRAVWEVTLPSMSPGGPHSIFTNTEDDCSVRIDDVLFGDVWICSGQTNMQLGLNYIDGGDEELDQAVNYPYIRTYHAELAYSDDPLYDAPEIRRNWAVADSENIADFSGVCWVFGRHLYDELQYPIGLIHSTWGGTVIESWSSPDANAECFEEGQIPEDEPPNGPSQLWNAMVNPYIRMSIYGYLYYQGESNYGRPDDFACSFPAMITDYRAKWFEATEGATDPMFPFGFVQISPWIDLDKDTGYPDIRWAQTVNRGVVPNDDLVNVFMGTAVDLPDYDAPEGAAHPRYKKQISDRLALGAFALAYGLETHGRFQGPFPTSLNLVDDELTVVYDNGEAALVFRNSDGFEVCCSPDTEILCNPKRLNNTDPQQWTAAPVIVQGTSDLTLDISCEVDQHVTGIRYIWRESPCPLEACAVYSVDNSVPAPPFRFEGYIAPTK